MNIDLHSHFFPLEALQNPGKYENRAPKVVLDKGKLSVTSQIGFRPGLGAGAYDASARIKALDEMQIDIQAISPSPILLFYWEEPAVAAHFSRKQNEAIQAIAQKHPDRFVGFGSVPLQSVEDSIVIAEEAKSMGLRGLEIGNAVGDSRSMIRASNRFSKPLRNSICFCSFIPWKGGSTPMIPFRQFLATCCNSLFARR